MMRKLIDYMSDDHKRLDGIFKVFRQMKTQDAKKAMELLHAFKAGLKRHILWEEEILFPLVEGRIGAMNGEATSAMREEHRDIQNLLEVLHDKMVHNDSATDGPERVLVDALTAHGEKEKNGLYPMIDDSIDERRRVEIYKGMKDLSPERYNRCCE